MCDNDDSAHVHAAITVRNERESPLLRLPGEIRNSIYGYAVKEGTYKFISWRDKKGVDMARDNLKPHRLALLSVCRQTHHEAAMLPFTLNTFCFHGSLGFLRCGYYFTDRQRHAIKEIHIVSHYSDVQWFRYQLRELVPFTQVHPGVQRVTVNIRQRSSTHLLKRFPCLSRTPPQCPDYMEKPKKRLEKWFQGNDRERKLEVVIRPVLMPPIVW